MAFEPPEGANEIDSAIENLVLTLKRYDRLAEASDYEAKLLVYQLRRERLRAQTAMARTRALLAEMQLHVVQTYLNAMKKQSPSDETSAPNHQRPLTLPVNHEQNKASERKLSKTDSDRPSLHKLDKKSLSIAKPTCKNCLKLQTRKQRTSESTKSSSESEPQIILSDANKNATMNNAVPEASKSFKESDIIDVIPPSKDKAEFKRSNNAVIPETNNEESKTIPTVGTSIAKKIFGIANYNIGQHEKMVNSGKESRTMLQEIAKRTSTPKENSKNKANQARKAAKPSLCITSQKDKASVPKKLATVTDVMTKGTGKEQMIVKEAPSLRISLPLPSKLNTKVDKIRKSLFGVTKQHCSAEDKIPSKAIPIVGSSKKEKGNQISHYKNTESPHRGKVAPREKIEAKVHADKDMRRRGKENVKPQSLHNIADVQNKKDDRKSVEVETKKEQRENKNVVKPSVWVSLPLTKSNLANFNRNNVFRQWQETAQERTTQVAGNNLKPYQSLKISVPLNNCLSYREAQLERNNTNQEFVERQTGRHVAWKSINWDAWEAQKKKEEYARPEVDKKQRPNYTFKNGPMRKVSWEEFTRRLSMNQGTNALSQSTSAKKTCVKPTVNSENAENLPATTAAYVGTNEYLKIPSTPSAENEVRTKETARQITKSEVDHEATNAIFNQIMVKKEIMNASNADDSRSISSNDTARLCTRCECLHQSKECPMIKYFKFLGIENFETEI